MRWVEPVQPLYSPLSSPTNQVFSRTNQVQEATATSPPRESDAGKTVKCTRQAFFSVLQKKCKTPCTRRHPCTNELPPSATRQGQAPLDKQGVGVCRGNTAPPERMQDCRQGCPHPTLSNPKTQTVTFREKYTALHPPPCTASLPKAFSFSTNIQCLPALGECAAVNLLYAPHCSQPQSQHSILFALNSILEHAAQRHPFLRRRCPGPGQCMPQRGG